MIAYFGGRTSSPPVVPVIIPLLSLSPGTIISPSKPLHSIKLKNVFWRAPPTSVEVMQLRFSLALINKRRARVGDKYHSHAPSARKSAALQSGGDENTIATYDTHTSSNHREGKGKKKKKKIRRLTTIPTVSLARASVKGKRLRTRVCIYI